VAAGWGVDGHGEGGFLVGWALLATLEFSPMTAPLVSPLRRFVVDGLRATLDSHAADALPLHRLVWELDNRLDTLAELSDPPGHRPLLALCTAVRVLAEIDTELRASGRARPTDAERHTVAVVAALRSTLARLDSADPLDPLEAAPPRPPLASGSVGSHAPRSSSAHARGVGARSGSGRTASLNSSKRPRGQGCCTKSQRVVRIYSVLVRMGMPCSFRV